MVKMDEAVLKEIEADSKPKVSDDKLEFIRDKIRETRDIDQRIADLSEQIGDLKRVRQGLIFDTLPTMFMQIGLNHLGVAAQGNMPAYEAKLQDHYHAVISSEWSEEKKSAALKWAHKRKLGDLIKTTVTVELGLGQARTIKKLLDALKKMRITPKIEETIPWQTLTAYVKERYKAGKPLSDEDLRTICASVNKVVKLTPVREK